ncbi:MAG TPA: WYL domain-containing protein [Bacteroidales bacterium]|nr:WYL domain-containing protein [Bacteroidales bacterium]
MAKNIFNRYVWLLDTINLRPNIAYQEINNLWRDSPLNDDGKDLPLRTFHNHRQAILDQFGLDIVYSREVNGYYIDNLSDLKGGNIKNWLFETLAVNKAISEKVGLKDRIVTEFIPSSHKYLSIFLDAMKNNRSMTITYRTYYSDNDSLSIIHPYFIKLFKQIWYVVAYNKTKKAIRMYALDRIVDLKTNDSCFEFPKKLSSEAYFNDYFGVIVIENVKKETVIIKVYKDKVKYIRALPIHHSQKEIEIKDDYSLFQYKIRPTYDFKQAIFSNMYEFEIISPLSFREEIKETIDRMAELYKKLPS